MRRLLSSQATAEPLRRTLSSVLPLLEVIVQDPDGPPPDVQIDAALVSIDVANLGKLRPFLARVCELPNVSWVHHAYAGMAYPGLYKKLLERGVTVSYEPGINAHSVTEFVIAWLLKTVKPFDTWMENQRSQRWQWTDVDDLHGRTLGIIGLGHIGLSVARAASVLGMQVFGCRRNAQLPSPDVERVFPPEAVHEMASMVDYLVVAVPLTSETKALIGARMLSAMKHRSWLINVGRASLIDEAALVQALHTGKLAGAVLDDMEDQGDLSPVWTAPNLYFTPHTAGRSRRVVEHAVRSFTENLTRRLAGEPLPHVFSIADVI